MFVRAFSTSVPVKKQVQKKTTCREENESSEKMSAR